MPRALAGNPDGTELLAGALHAGVRLGFEAGAPCPAATIEEARALAVAAARELDLHGRALRRVGFAGQEAAEAGASLAVELSEPAVALGAPREAVAAQAGPPQPDGTVRVAVAANQAEAELLRGLLSDAGIPSTWRRTGGDLPELLGAGYREVYVPAAAGEEAAAVLATMELPEDDDDPTPTRRVGLERTGLRLAGKWTAAFLLVTSAFAVTVGGLTASLVAGVASFVAALAISALIVTWSERARSG